MDDEHLINLVQKFDFLYDKGKIALRDIQSKRDAWEAISNEMHSSVDICQRRWNALRERFSREKRQDVPSGSGFEKKPSWTLLQNMLFLKPFVKVRRIRSSSNVLSIEEISKKVIMPETFLFERRTVRGQFPSYVNTTFAGIRMSSNYYSMAAPSISFALYVVSTSGRLRTDPKMSVLLNGNPSLMIFYFVCALLFILVLPAVCQGLDFPTLYATSHEATISSF